MPMQYFLNEFSLEASAAFTGCSTETEPSASTIAYLVQKVKDEKNPKQYKFRTKGDANKNVDANLIEPNQVLGKAIFSIPYLGYLATYIQTPSGSIVTICFAVSSIILVVIIDILVDSDKKNKKTTKK